MAEPHSPSVAKPALPPDCEGGADGSKTSLGIAPTPEQRMKAFDFAQESLKQVLTLATASLGGAIALLDDPAHRGVQFTDEPNIVLAGLSFLVASIGFGLLALFNLSGTLERPPETGPSIYKPSIQFFWGGHLLLFACGLGILVAAAT